MQAHRFTNERWNDVSSPQRCVFCGRELAPTAQNVPAYTAQLAGQMIDTWTKAMTGLMDAWTQTVTTTWAPYYQPMLQPQATQQKHHQHGHHMERCEHCEHDECDCDECRCCVRDADLLMH